MLRLGVNIDHVATLRQARYAGMLDLPHCEPDILAAAGLCEKAGAHGITVHLRADRRHIQDEDVKRLRASLLSNLNLEMGNTPEILEIALRVLPDDVCLVPENRKEITTEGGLDVLKNMKALGKTIQRLQKAGVRVSLFIEPAIEQVEAAGRLGADFVELHTGAFANAPEGPARDAQLQRVIDAAVVAHDVGLKVNAGHGINYTNIKQIHRVPFLQELNIGHSIVCRAVMVGLETAVREMLQAMAGYRLGPEQPI